MNDLAASYNFFMILMLDHKLVIKLLRSIYNLQWFDRDLQWFDRVSYKSILFVIFESGSVFAFTLQTSQPIQRIRFLWKPQLYKPGRWSGQNQSLCLWHVKKNSHFDSPWWINIRSLLFSVYTPPTTEQVSSNSKAWQFWI